MKSDLFEMEFYETYHLASLVHDVILEPTDHEDGLRDFFDRARLNQILRPFPRDSVLHRLILHVIQTLTAESVDDVEVDAFVNTEGYAVWANRALREHEIDHVGLHEWLKGRRIKLGDFEEATLEE